MKHPAATRSILALAFLATACGRQESVEEVQADRARAEAPPVTAARPVKDSRVIATGPQRTYANSAHGFSITLPEGWVRNDGASNADGVVYEDPGAGADIRVFWAKNGENADIRQIVAGMHDGAEGVEGNYTSPSEYRGAATDGRDNRVSIRVLKLADGSAVSATVTYPEMLSDQYAAIGKAALDSLTLATAP